ncbi:MAG: PilZ domain-containing protein [Thermodesulfovibrio sp.]|uniref:PilZ domain-containing protein n=1 Tax=unclassified Thermodesulfovibrio TaxID=2645936 RepID=UPI00083B3999|nr:MULTISPECIES: PilZ domain-containing protein [unclassified Thermodesulfovibrio]MDI1472130.1 PilZ domain-containing protein [Thermodesulfovibrio sp. 1176]MDI6715223.1 PilZ domain-containing protein [Thermodesulfovibrio sp.]ODA45122.1 hypothetical protein THER_0201 [Thermodesulfovibrio sp. N1]
MEKKEIYEKLREHVRQDVKIPFSVKLISSQELEMLSTKIFGYINLYEAKTVEDTNYNISERLNRIEEKIDAILDMFLLQQHGFFNLPESIINLSGGGLSFISDKHYNKGDFLEIKMLLPEPTPVGVITYGEVVRAEKKEGKTEIGVKFIKLNEKERDFIIRFVIYKERQKLRGKNLQ